MGTHVDDGDEGGGNGRWSEGREDVSGVAVEEKQGEDDGGEKEKDSDALRGGPGR